MWSWNEWSCGGPGGMQLKAEQWSKWSIRETDGEDKIGKNVAVFRAFAVAVSIAGKEN